MNRHRNVTVYCMLHVRSDGLIALLFIETRAESYRARPQVSMDLEAANASSRQQGHWMPLTQAEWEYHWLLPVSQQDVKNTSGPEVFFTMCVADWPVVIADILIECRPMIAAVQGLTAAQQWHIIWFLHIHVVYMPFLVFLGTPPRHSIQLQGVSDSGRRLGLQWQ